MTFQLGSIKFKEFFFFFLRNKIIFQSLRSKDESSWIGFCCSFWVRKLFACLKCHKIKFPCSSSTQEKHKSFLLKLAQNLPLTFIFGEELAFTGQSHNIVVYESVYSWRLLSLCVPKQSVSSLNWCPPFFGGFTTLPHQFSFTSSYHHVISTITNSWSCFADENQTESAAKFQLFFHQTRQERKPTNFFGV